MRSKVPVDHERLAEFCREGGVRRLAIFGSALRDDFELGSIERETGDVAAVAVKTRREDGLIGR